MYFSYCIESKNFIYAFSNCSVNQNIDLKKTPSKKMGDFSESGTHRSTNIKVKIVALLKKNRKM